MKISDPRFLSILNKEFREENETLYFIKSEHIKSYDSSIGVGINKIKSFLKSYPRLYEFLRAGLSPGISCIKKLSPQRAVAKVFGLKNLADRVIVSIGSGTKIIHPEAINLDIYPFTNVDIVADARFLPFKDNSVDMIICESFLEHVLEVDKVINEINRVVKKGGYVYVSVPFVYPFHASPNDYFRWSRNGLRKSFVLFEEMESGMRAGPMAALQGVLMHLLAMPLSLGINWLYLFWSNFFMLILAPIKFLDIFFSFIPQADEIAADIYLLGKKM